MKKPQPRLRSMSDIATARDTARCSLPRSRAQAEREQIYLEHAQARLEQERALWRKNLRQTEQRLQQIAARRASLLQLLDPDAQPAPLQPTVASEPLAGWQAMTLEY